MKKNGIAGHSLDTLDPGYFNTVDQQVIRKACDVLQLKCFTRLNQRGAWASSMHHMHIDYAHTSTATRPTAQISLLRSLHGRPSASPTSPDRER